MRYCRFLSSSDLVLSFSKVCALDDGSITVDCPADMFPDKGYFTLYDAGATLKGIFICHSHSCRLPGACINHELTRSLSCCWQP